MKTPETKAKISAALMGHPVSAETRAKISAAASRSLVGRPVSAATRARIAEATSADRAHQWAGDDVGYSGAHKRHRASLPRLCEHCGTTEGRLDVALRHDAAPNDYMRLCRSCHLRYDRHIDALARP